MEEKREKEKATANGRELSAILSQVVPDEELSAVALRTRTASDGSLWASFIAFMKEEMIADILDKADPSWEWVVREVRPVTVQGRGTNPIEGTMVLGDLIVRGRNRMGMGFDVDPRAAATYAFKDAAQKWGVGRFLARDRYSLTVRFPDEAAFRRFVNKKPSWAEVVAYYREKGGDEGKKGKE